MWWLQELSEFFRNKSGILRDTTHGVSIHRIVPRFGDNPGSIGHDDVLALAYDSGIRLLESGDCAQMIDPGNTRHGSDRNLHFPDLLTLE